MGTRPTKPKPDYIGIETKSRLKRDKIGITKNYW